MRCVALLLVFLPTDIHCVMCLYATYSIVSIKECLLMVIYV